MASMFTKPDRSNYMPNFTKSAENDAIDIGWTEGFLSDGRAFRAEAWAQDGITSVTLFMPTAGIETQTNEQFVELLEREKLLLWEPRLTRSVYAMPYTDAAGASMWSINVVIGDEDRLYARDTFRFHPYAATIHSPGGANAQNVELTPAKDGKADSEETVLNIQSELSDFDLEPDQLLHWGYRRVEEETTDPVRKVWYTKAVSSASNQLRLTVKIEFDLGISDEPHLSYNQAHSYFFVGVMLDVQHRQMEGEEGDWLDEETESPYLVGQAPLRLTTLQRVEDLAALLKLS